MIATEWDIYFDDICAAIAKKSKDPQTKLGCVIASKDYSILSTGFNGFCRGIDETNPDRWANRTTRYFYVEHAERNCIYNAVRHGVCLNNSIAYVPVWPCVECAKGLIQSGIIEVRMNWERIEERRTSLSKRFTKEEFDKWIIELNDVRAMLNEAGVLVNTYDIIKDLE